MRYLFVIVIVCGLGVAPLGGCFNDFLEGYEGPCLRAGLDCDDGNLCTRDHCENVFDLSGAGESGPRCAHEPTNGGTQCSFADISGTCRGGLCGAEHLCDGVVCEDDDICTDDTCAWDGTCAFTNVRCD